MLDFNLQSCDKSGGMTLIVKPTHGCNLNCEYCYDAEHRKQYGKFLMSHDTVADIVKSIPSGYMLTWIWHGGEPSTVPVKWYEKSMKILNSRTDLVISQSMQTNGIAVSDELIDLCVKYNIRMGTSYDLFATTRSKSKIRDNVINFMSRYKSKIGNESVGAISVITRENQNHLVEMWKYATEELNYVPAFNRVFNTVEADKHTLYIQISEYKTAIRAFCEYLFSRENTYRVERTIRAVASSVMGFPNGLCIYGDCRGRWATITPDGHIYPCDTGIPSLGEPPYISEYQDNITRFFLSDYYQRYNGQVNYYRHKHCENCKIRQICCCGCPVRILQASDLSSKFNTEFCAQSHSEVEAIFDLLWNTDFEYLNKDMLELANDTKTIYPFELRKFLNMLPASVSISDTEYETYLKVIEYIKNCLVPLSEIKTNDDLRVPQKTVDERQMTIAEVMKIIC